MDHVDILLPDYIRGRLEEEARRGVDDHLRLCSRCRQEEGALREVLLRISQIPLPSVPDAYFATLLPRIRARLESHQVWRPRLTPSVARVIIPLAAAMLILAVVLRLEFRIPSAQSESETNPLHLIAEEISADELRLVLADQLLRQPLFGTTLDPETIQQQVLRTRAADLELLERSQPQSILFDNGVSVSESLNELSDAEVQRLLRLLGERSIL
jgi:hypothetical protein